MDWYLVYNPDNSYDLAIKYLYDHPRNKWKNASFQEFNRLLNSSEYKKDKRQLSKEEIEYIIFYVSGDYLKNNSLPKNKKVIISNCLICGDSDIDKIDYISFNLMSRPSTVDECNILLDILKSNNTKSETDKWLMILDKIMTFEDFITK
jgi:hypothetical protein